MGPCRLGIGGLQGAQTVAPAEALTGLGNSSTKSGWRCS